MQVAWWEDLRLRPPLFVRSGLLATTETRYSCLDVGSRKSMRSRTWLATLFVGACACGNAHDGGGAVQSDAASATTNGTMGASSGTTERASDAGVSGPSASSAGGNASATEGSTVSSNSGGAGASANASGEDATSGAGSPSTPEPVDCRLDGDGKTTVSFVNLCAQDVQFRGSDIDPGVLVPGAFACRDIGSAEEELSAKRYWGFSGEDPGPEHHTLAEFTFNTDFYDFDWYNISHVDAFNLPMQIAPVARPACESLTCAEDLLSGCPDAGQLRDANGELLACVNPDRDNPDSPVALHFESCDDAYAWSGDDQQGDDPSPVRACAGEDFDVVFCPEALP